MFELHRQRRREPELLQSKADELRGVDEEVRELADALEEGEALTALTARGLVAACTGCGGLMGSRDRFCPGCGAGAGAASNGNGNGNAGWNGDSDRGADGEPMQQPDFGETHEVAALNGDAPEEAEPEQPVPAAPEPLVPRAQRTMRAGRRMARQWLAQRRPDGP